MSVSMRRVPVVLSSAGFKGRGKSRPETHPHALRRGIQETSRTQPDLSKSHWCASSGLLPIELPKRPSALRLVLGLILLPEYCFVKYELCTRTKECAKRRIFVRQHLTTRHVRCARRHEYSNLRKRKKSRITNLIQRYRQKQCTKFECPTS